MSGKLTRTLFGMLVLTQAVLAVNVQPGEPGGRQQICQTGVQTAAR